MAKEAEILKSDDGIFHVYARGNNGAAIFSGPDDFIGFRGVLAKCKQKHRLFLFHYELMSNHYHLLLATDADELPKAMHRLNREYSLYHKRKYGRVGTLWQGRYRSRPIRTQAQMLICAAYIELNAVRAGIVSDPADYLWGSYRHYVGIESDDLIDPDPEYLDLAPTEDERRRLYKLCIELWESRHFQPVSATPRFKQVAIPSSRLQDSTRLPVPP